MSCEEEEEEDGLERLLCNFAARALVQNTSEPS